MDVNALVAEVSERLGLERAAQRDALAGLPKRHSKLTDTENGAIAEAERCGRKEVQRIDDCLAKAREAIQDCDSTLTQTGPQRQLVENQSPPPAADLGGLAEDRDSAIAAYNAFKVDNGLVRDATGDDRVTQLAWAGVIILLEAAVNAYFYMPITELGLLGGLFVALISGLVNVAIAFFGGAAGLRFLSHIDPLKKLGGVLASIVCLAICALVVSLLALYRGHVDALHAEDLDALTIRNEAWRLALASLQNLDVWALFSSLNSFLLVFVGILCAVVGFWKGWSYDDPYPGYGRMLRRKDEAVEAHENARQNDQKRQSQWRDGRLTALRAAASDLTRATARVSSASEGLWKTFQDSGQLATQTAQLANGLLGVYRNKNAAVRADPPPPYFDDFFDNEHFPILASEMNRCSQEIEHLRRREEQLKDACSEEQSSLQRALNRTRDRLMPATSKRRQRIAPFTLLAILVAIFVALAIVLVSPKQPFDPDTLCPDDGDYPRTAVVIDATDPLSSSQAKAISEEISSLRRELAVNEWVGIFVLNEDNLTLPSPEIALCNPGDESTANPLYENPDQVRRRFERKFRKPMEQAVERLAQLPLSPTSPILEMIRAVALDRSFDSTKERRLIIISDMLHNVPAYSHYRESADFLPLAEDRLRPRVSATLAVGCGS